MGGIVPLAYWEILTGVTEIVTSGMRKTEPVQVGNAASDCRNMVKTLAVEEPNIVEITILRVLPGVGGIRRRRWSRRGRP